MIRVSMPSLLAAFLLAVPCAAEEWAEKMFTARSYDFGSIARGANAEFAFEMTNLYLEDVHIASVRTTCGCTTPRIEKDTLKAYEKGAVIAHINSDRFVGNQGATITVTIDKPQYAQVQLQVKVHIFSDVLLEPSSAVLGSVAQGNLAERMIRVRYTGRSDWHITEVRSGNPHLAGTVTETSRQGGPITYDLKVVLGKDAPVGNLSEHVWLITDDPQTKHIAVSVKGEVVGAISFSPSALFLGVVQPGQSVAKQIVVRGQKPFRITSIRGDCECLKATTPKDQEPKALYLVPITFTAGEKTGRITQVIHIETDLDPTVLKVPVYAVVGGQ
ncbi:MAG: DUF1573 domain-containing protein [Pirellulales bacterium]